MGTIDRVKNLKKHLQNQIKEADHPGSDWVYLLKTDAEKCLELAQEEETFAEVLAEKKDYEAFGRVTRCRDCKHYRQSGHYCGYSPVWGENKRHLYGIGCSDDWYCADGERKEIK